MNIRQTAYLFGLVRAMAPSRVVEIGRYKGGSTLVIAAAMVQAVGIPRGGAAGDFKLVKQVCRLAHLERVR